LFQVLHLTPRCRTNPGKPIPSNWRAEGPDAVRSLAMLDYVQKTYKIDAKRIYLTGLSMGGFGTWSLAAKYPERWAAIVPICGGVRGDKDEVAKKIKDIP